jgi:transcriptional regulator with XRE-family HTH domain
MNQTERVGANIKRFRELAGLSKSELARRIKVSPTAVHNWEENGVIPRLEVMLDLERVLEVSWVQLRNHGLKTGPTSTDSEDESSSPQVSRGERLEQLKRQIAALFEVSPDKVEIVVRT